MTRMAHLKYQVGLPQTAHSWANAGAHVTYKANSTTVTRVSRNVNFMMTVSSLTSAPCNYTKETWLRYEHTEINTCIAPGNVA